MLTGLKVSFLVHKGVLYEPERTGKWGPHRIEILILKCINEIYQQIELKE